MQWWALPTSPMRPSRSRSAIQNSHSGRSRRSGSDSTASASCGRSSAAERWMCSAGSKCSASIHSGACSPSASGAIRWRKRGARASRPAMWANRSSKSGRGPSTGGSNVAAHPTCMCALGPSTVRNDASSADSRWGGIRSPLSGSVRSPLRSRDPSSSIEATHPGARRRVFLRTGYGRGSDVLGEGVAGGRVAVFEAALEPAGALLRGAVRERLGVDLTRRLGLDAVVADRRGGGQALLEVALARAARARTSNAPTRPRGSRPAARPAPTARCAGRGSRASPCRPAG